MQMHETTSVTELHAHLIASLKPACPIELVGLELALGRVLAHPLVAQFDVPPCDNSAVDGYALVSEDITLRQLTALQLIAHQLAGPALPITRLLPGQCIRIMTGAPIPPGANAVVMLEHTTLEGDQVKLKPGPCTPGQNIRRQGEDIRAGSKVLKAGRKLDAYCLGLAASLGISHIEVMKKLRVAVISTGTEIADASIAYRTPGVRYDSNRPMLLGLIAAQGYEAIDLGIVPDEPLAIQAALARAGELADVVITSGGASHGDADYTAQAFASLGKLASYQLALKPGRPYAQGQFASTGAQFFGLPGNPVAAAVVFELLVKDALAVLQGQTLAARTASAARCLTPLGKVSGRVEVIRAMVSLNREGELIAEPSSAQGSGQLSSMTQANAFIVLEESQGPVKAGELVSVRWFDAL
jgi:molybdopterin molybdotransferase